VLYYRRIQSYFNFGLATQKKKDDVVLLLALGAVMVTKTVLLKHRLSLQAPARVLILPPPHRGGFLVCLLALLCSSLL
jgi:hypothetical protein